MYTAGLGRCAGQGVKLFVVRISRDAFDQDLRNRYVEGHLYSSYPDDLPVNSDGGPQVFGVQTSCMPADYFNTPRGEALVVTLFGLPGGRAALMASEPRLPIPAHDIEVGFALPAANVVAVTALVRYALNRLKGNEDDEIAYLLPEPDALLLPEELSHAHTD